jgi:hypothetical protein
MNDNNNDETVIDVNGYGAAQTLTNVSYSSGVDTITIGDINSLTSPSISTITIPTTYSSGATVGGIVNTNWNSTYTVNPGINYSNNTWQSTATVNIDNTGLNMAEGSDIKIGERSLKDFMTKMEERMAILVPDPKKLEKFEALKKAYEHYKTMESLCFDEPKEEDQ